MNHRIFERILRRSVFRGAYLFECHVNIILLLSKMDLDLLSLCVRLVSKYIVACRVLALLLGLVKRCDSYIRAEVAGLFELVL